MGKHKRKTRWNWYRISVYTILMLALVAVWGLVAYGILLIAEQL